MISNKSIALIVKELVPYRNYFFYLIEQKMNGKTIFILDKQINDESKKLLDMYPISYEVIKHNIPIPNILFKQNRFKRYIPIGLFTLLYKYRPDIIICPEYSLQTMIAVLYKKAFKCTLIIWCSLTEYDKRISYPYQESLRAIIRKHAAAFITYSTAAKDYLKNRGISEQIIFVAYNSTDVKYFIEQYKPKEIKSRDSILKLLYVGALEESKGLPELIKFLEKLRDKEWELTIIGNGKLWEFIKSNLLTKIGKIRLIGNISREKLPQYYLNSDYFIFPTRSDVWGHVIDEALSLGCPVISSSKCIAALEMINHGVNGFIYNSMAELSTVFDKILIERELSISMSSEAHKTMYIYNEEKTLTSFLNAISYVK